MEKLVIVRTNPEQGKSVKVSFTNGAGDVATLGMGEFPFPLWIQFEKLVKDGMEARARIETLETRRIAVEFRVPVETPKVELEEGSIPGRKQREAPVYLGETEVVVPASNEPVTLRERLARSLGGVSNLAREEGED